jgi:multidrug transporter EmrE-like cation transporter
MSLRLLLLTLVSVALSATAQIAFKLGAGRATGGLGAAGAVATAVAMLTNYYVVAGLFLYGLSALLWLVVLARQDLSVAYPFVGLGFVITSIAGAMLFNEHMTPMRVLGTALVTLGVVLVGMSASK